METILTSECEKCVHGTLIDSDKAKIKIFCDDKNKYYYYGQYVPCDKKTKIKEKC